MINNKVEVLLFKNLDLHTVKTPVNVQAFEKLLIESEYDARETQFLINGFKEGFSIEKLATQ